MYFSTAIGKSIATVKDITISSYTGGIDNHKINDALFQYTALETLHISGDFLELSPQIGQLKKLRYLSISSNLLKKLPKEIGNLSQLQNLSITLPKLEACPEEIRNLSALTSISIWRNTQLKSVPTCFSELPNLRRLDIYFGSFNQLEAFHSGFSTLEQLSFSECDLTDQHWEAILHLTQLQSLFLSKNAFQHIPKGILNLKQLHSLALDHNQIKTIPSFLTELKELRSFLFNDNEVAEFPSFLDQLAHLGKIGWYNNPIGKFDKALLSFPIEVSNPFTKHAEAKRYREEIEKIAAYNFSETTLGLFADIKTGRSLGPHYSRQDFVALSVYDHSSFKSLVLEKLADYEKERLEQHPLDKDSELVVIGNASIPKTKIKTILKENGIAYQAKISPNTTHLIVGSTGVKDCSVLENENYILISPQAFQDYINTITKPYLLEEENQESHQHIAELLVSQDPENQSLGIELLKGGGTPTDLLTELFIVFKFTPDKKLAAKAKKLLSTHGSSALVEALKLRINLKTVADYYKTEDKIERLCAGNELEAWKIAQFAFRYKADIWYPKIPLGLKDAPEKQAIEFLKEAVLQKTHNGIYTIKEAFMPYLPMLYKHCDFLKGLEFDRVSSAEEGLRQLENLETFIIRFADNIALPKDLHLLPHLKNVRLSSISVPDWKPVLEQLGNTASLENLYFWSTMKEGLHPDMLQLQQIKLLGLWNIALQKKDLELLSQLSNLESLLIDASYKELHEDFLVLTNISKLTFNKDQKTAHWVTKELHQLKNLRSLTLNGPIGLHDEFSQCTQLEELYIQTNYNRPRPILASNIRDLVHLKRLTIRGAAVDLEEVLPSFQDLEHLELYHQEMNQELLLDILKQLPKLKTFNRWLGNDLQQFEAALPHVLINQK